MFTYLTNCIHFDKVQYYLVSQYCFGFYCLVQKFDYLLIIVLFLSFGDGIFVLRSENCSGRPKNMLGTAVASKVVSFALCILLFHQAF